MLSHSNEIIVFLITANLVVAGFAIFFFFVLKTQQKRKILHRQQLLEKEYKTREETIHNISRDLHDEIGSSLSGINLFAQITEQQLRQGQTKEANEFLQKIKDYSETVIEKTGDLVWMLRPENDTQEKMIERLKVYAASVTKARQVQLFFELSPGFLLPVDHLLYRKNIYLICKEAINNAVKYSECTTLKILFDANTITISDNGGGFDLQKENLGQGLQNMKQRAAEAAIEIEFQSGLSKGTVVALIL